MRVPCVDRIGHLTLDLDSYLKENKLLLRRVRPIFLLGEKGSSRSAEPANVALLRYWSKYIRIVSPGLIWRILAAVREHGGWIDDLADYTFNITISARAYEVQSKWGNMPPLLALTKADRVRGQAVLREMGVPQGAWFVCLHAREGGYSPSDEHLHSYRNADIASYDQAIETIMARGGWCIRMGDKSMRPIRPTANVIDYALSSFKSDWLDIYLCASCRFYLGGNSGLSNVAGAFGRMSVLTNTAPLTCSYSPFPFDLVISKQMFREGRRLTFAEGFSSEIGPLRLAAEFRNAGITFVDNSSEEIAALVGEAFDRLDRTAVYSIEDEVLQSRLRSLVQAGQACWPPSSRVGRAYLRSRATELLP